MRAVVISIALVLPIGVVMALGTANGASDAPAPAPAAAGQVTFIPIDRTHVLLAPPPRPSVNGAQPQSGADSLISPSSGAGEHPPMPIYPPPGTTR